MSHLQSLRSALEYGFLNDTQPTTELLKPKLLTNDTSTNVLSTLLKELLSCQSFCISVAFITSGGLTMLKAALADLAARNIHGKILTSTYLQFNQPHVFEQLLRIPNVEVRITAIEGFHAKGYIFEQQHYETLIIGSSNLTQSALKTNYEWNVKLNSLQNGDLLKKFKQQFEHVWQKAMPLSPHWLDHYAANYMPQTPFRQKIAEQQQVYSTVSPNKMQQQALQQLQTVRDHGEQRALVISATGTGKTYLSAFDVQQVAPQTLLFVVHREQILKKAMAQFKTILQLQDHEIGLLTGASKQSDCRYLFATVQTISKPDVLAQFTRSHFDYIIVDEVHKAGARSYLRVLEHFSPKFLLGMTATPERTDDYNIFQLFDYNIAYEIRLQQALEEEMLCPFHYFGVTDYQQDGLVINEKTDFNQLIMDERINHLIDKIHYYGHDGSETKGLIFCSRKEEALALSHALNHKGLRTIALTGDTHIEKREQAIRALEDGQLTHLITVDILNEGIDIPMLNQIVMLRQTQSSIIFLQQLGRGLRKHPSKSYVTIIDFIGNYKNNYMIPMALAGDYSFNKDNLRRHTMEATYIKGVSSIHFEEIAKKRIFESLQVPSLITFKHMVVQFEELQRRLGHTPLLVDFIKHRLLDPHVLLTKKANYDAFLCTIQKQPSTLSATAQHLLTFVSQELINGKRLHEILLLKLLLQTPKLSKRAFQHLLVQCQLQSDAETLTSVENMLTLKFFTNPSRQKYGHISLLLVEEHYVLHPDIQAVLDDKYVHTLFVDVLDCAFRNNEQYDRNPFTINAKYSRKDYCRLMNWRSDMSSVIYGYKIDDATKTCPLFIRYHKDDTLNTAVLYEDELINTHELKWFTRPGKKITSPIENRIFYDDSLTLHIFIQKDGAEGADFYYLGEATPQATNIEEHLTENKSGRQVPIVSAHFTLKNEINETIYHYLTTN